MYECNTRRLLSRILRKYIEPKKSECVKTQILIRLRLFVLAIVPTGFINNT